MAKKMPAPVPDPLVLPSAISADEGAYLTTLIAQRKDADLTLQKFTAYLAQKYQLREGDGLTPDGAITRKAPA